MESIEAAGTAGEAAKLLVHPRLTATGYSYVIDVEGGHDGSSWAGLWSVDGQAGSYAVPEVGFWEVGSSSQTLPISAG
jgi:hypothetical protein